jgi:anti-sigma regulatory factor (Ser/Thr protein kinase)
MTIAMAAVDVRLSSSAMDLAPMRAALDRVAAAAGAPREAVVDMAIALDEVVSNVLRCAFPDGGDHPVCVSLRADAEAIEAQVRDDGVPFDPRGVAEPEVETDVATARVGGRGILFVRALMDGFEYARVGGENRVSLRRLYRRTATSG